MLTAIKRCRSSSTAYHSNYHQICSSRTITCAVFILKRYSLQHRLSHIHLWRLFRDLIFSSSSPATHNHQIVKASVFPWIHLLNLPNKRKLVQPNSFGEKKEVLPVRLLSFLSSSIEGWLETAAGEGHDRKRLSLTYSCSEQLCPLFEAHSDTQLKFLAWQ